jgi:hydroxymethylpyrimidine/phosphomethylpyrimidine kinase
VSERAGAVSVHAVDTAGEEGVLADRAVLTELDCRSASAISAILVHAGATVVALEPVSLSLLAQQVDAALSLLRPVAARTGILTDPRQVELVAEMLGSGRVSHLVVAPVLRVAATRVLTPDTLAAMRRFLYPQATVVVVRAADLHLVTGASRDGLDSMRAAAAAIRSEGARAVLVTGGASKGRILDLLDADGRASVLDASRVAAPPVAGLAGAHAAALTGHLARGLPLEAAAVAAQRYVSLRLLRGR